MGCSVALSAQVHHGGFGPGIVPEQFKESKMYKTAKDQRLVITTEQLIQANAESIRLDFSRTLDLPPKCPRLTYPVLNVWQDNNNVRLTIGYWESVEAARSGQSPGILILDVTKPWLKKLEKSSRRILKNVKI